MILQSLTEFLNLAVEGEQDAKSSQEAQVQVSNSIHYWRDLSKLSQTGLADLSNVPQAYISQIETGKRTGSVTTLNKLTQAIVDEIQRRNDAEENKN